MRLMWVRRILVSYNPNAEVKIESFEFNTAPLFLITPTLTFATLFK